MCSVLILIRPDHSWPVLIAANRDEMVDRPWLPPARHWPDRPEITAGMDQLAGGSWMGINDYGLVAAILNGPHALGPADGLRSRGEIVLEALDHADADAAAAALAELDPASFRPFHLLLIDNMNAFVISCDTSIKISKLPAGLHMITAHGLNSPASPRYGRYFPLFKKATTPQPEIENWRDWHHLMISQESDADAAPMGAMFIRRPDGFGTTSTAFLALPHVEQDDLSPIFCFIDHRQDVKHPMIVMPFSGRYKTDGLN